MMWSGTGIEPIWFVRPLVIAVGLTLGLTLALTLLLGDRDRAGLVATSIVVALAFDDARVAAAVLVGSGLLLAEGIARRGRPWRRGPIATRAMSALGAALLLVVGVSTVQEGSFAWAVEDIQLRLRHDPPADAYDPSAPDIYVILLDGYPGDDAARLAPGFDADAFPAALAQRGFDVQRHSRSNYLLTRLTLASMLGNVHILDSPALAAPHGSRAAESRRMRRITERGPILAALAAAGYERIATGSVALDLGLAHVDRVMPPAGAQEFEFGLLRLTTAGHLVEAIAPEFVASLSRANVLGVIAGAEQVAAEPHDRPRFVYTHVMAPHPPMLFDAEGRPTGDSVLSDSFVEPTNRGRSQRRVEAEFDYAVWAGRRATEIVDAVLANQSADTVIVVLSDHGTDTGFDGRDPFASDLDERSSNFLAVRTPGHPGLLPPGTTPINVLPRILNAYLGTELPLHADTTWAWNAGGSVLDAVEVDLGSFTPVDR
jgi:hypothetical protein